MSSHNGGDQLARGARSATFPACESGVSEDKWKAAFEDYDSAAFLANQEAELKASRERKAQRTAELEAEIEQRDQERQAQRLAEQAANPEVNKNDENELRFGSRYAHAASSGILSPSVGEVVEEPGDRKN